MNLSIVIPLFNESESLVELHRQISAALANFQGSYEIIFIDDGSHDGSDKIIAGLSRQDNHIRSIHFRRNHGKSAALSEGFGQASGEIVITMDADLQDDPAEIPRLIGKINSGFDLVSGWKKERHDPLTKTIPSRLFNFVTRKLTGIRIHDFNCGLKAYRSEVIHTISVYGELHRYLPVLAHWQGFLVDEIIVRHHPRKFGKTKFGLRRFLHGFFDLFTILFLTRYNKKPLHLFGLLGMISFSFGFIVLLSLSINWFRGISINNRPLFFLGILMLIVGVQFFSLGLIGEMLTHNRESQSNYSVREQKKPEEN